MAKQLMWAAALGALLLVAFASARSEATTEAEAGGALPEMPLEEGAAAQGGGVGEWQPGDPYATGNGTRAIAIEELPAGEQARVEALAEAPLIPASAQAIYGATAAAALPEGVAAMASHELGLAELGALGVVLELTAPSEGGAP